MKTRRLLIKSGDLVTLVVLLRFNGSVYMDELQIYCTVCGKKGGKKTFECRETESYIVLYCMREEQKKFPD